MFRQTVEDWAKIVIDIWEEKALQLGIHDTFSLAQSFYFHILNNAGGDAARIEFAFNYYGTFQDMGVGKGTKLEDRSESSRVRKPWYTTTFFKQIKILSILIAEKFAHQGAVTIVENISDPKLRNPRNLNTI